jgi:hypothetical protein
MAKPTKTAVPPSQQTQAPTTAGYDWSNSANAGFENVQREDLGIPFLSIIQKGSPQFDQDHDDYATKGIPGCGVGDIFNNVSNTVVAKAGAEVAFIPCQFQKVFQEWTPREKGGGLVKSHMSAAILNECQRNEQGRDILRNGNIIVTTAYFFGLLLIDGERQTAVIGLTSTQLKKSKQWLNMAMSIKLTNAAGAKYTPPLFSHTYMLSTAVESNEKGSWRGWNIKVGTALSDPVLIAEAMDYSKKAVGAQRQLSAPPPEENVAAEVL